MTARVLAVLESTTGVCALALALGVAFGLAYAMLAGIRW